jgi:trimethylamine---corrinoid protein Co-methyltransferase
MAREGARIRRPRLPPAPTAPVERGLNEGASAAYAVLPPGKVEELVAAAIGHLETAGAGFEIGTEAMDLFAGAGCAIDAKGIVKIPAALVRQCLESVDKRPRLYDRAGEASLVLDCRHTWFFPGMTCIKVYGEDGEPRESTRADLETVTRVADALSNIDGVCIACKNVTRSDIHGEIDEFAAMAENTTKPLEYLCEHAASLGLAIEMASLIRGSRAALAEKPLFLQIVTPLPLDYHATHIEQVIMAARAGIPVSVGTLPIGGASTPITMAGSITHSLATDFAGMVLGQLAKPGSAVIGSSDVCFMEPATGGIGNFVQTSLADMVMCQIRRHLGLPSFTGIGGTSNARRFNADAVWEISSNMMQAFYSRPATLDYCGSLDQGLTYSLPALLLCDELAGMLRTLWQGVNVNEETLATELIRAVGPRGNFLAHRHTVSHCREQLWPARFLGPATPLSNDDRPDLELKERVEEQLARLRATHHPEPLAESVLAGMRAAQAAFRARHRA